MIFTKKSKNRLAASLGLTLLLLVAAACAPEGESPSLEGTAWSLVELNGRAALEGVEVTAGFTAGGVQGSSGCNSYGGPYQAETNGAFSTGDIVSTLMLCEGPAGVMEQEAEFLDALNQAASYRVSGELLEFDNPAGETILVFAPQP